MKFQVIKFFYRLNKKTLSLFILSVIFFSGLNAQISTCSGNAISYNPISGETYTWTVTSITGSVSGANVGQSATGTIINPTLINTSSSSATVTYDVKTLSNSNFTLVVTVNPIPNLSSSLTAPAICSGSQFNYNPSSTVTGTTLTWTRSINSDISTPPTSGNNNPNETLTSISSIPVAVNYIYTLNAGMYQSTNCFCCC